MRAWWETSLTRRATIAGFTYVIAAVWLHVIGNNAPLLNAAVPTGGYLRSTVAAVGAAGVAVARIGMTV